MQWQWGRLVALTLAAVVAGSNAQAADTKKDAKKETKEESSFSSLKAVDTAAARKQAEAWLKSAKKTDAASQKAFQAIWAGDKSILDKVTATLVLGDSAAAKLMKEARDENMAAPTEVPALLKDKKQSSFFRANLALAYGKALVNRKVYEEGLEALLAVKADEVVDPSVYFFNKAVCEHSLMLKEQADASIDRLLVDVTDAPERYRMVASLMHFDMLTWQEKDLGWIARKMDNIQRRLDLKRGGKKTQKMQKEVLVRLDEMIKELENKKKGGGGGGGGGGENDGNCPSGGDGGGSAPGQQNQSSNPQQDTMGGSAQGTGQIDQKRVKEITEVWGKLPEKKRAEALVELTRGMPAKDRAVIEAYFKKLTDGMANKNK